jgi:hypothetical protein
MTAAVGAFGIVSMNLSLQTNSISAFAYPQLYVPCIVCQRTDASLTLNGFPVFFTLSGFYQITKLCVIPTVLVFEWFTEGQIPTFCVNVSLSILLLGVGVATGL